MKSAKKNMPIVISDEHNEIKIYTTVGRNGPLYQMSFYRAGLRQRKSFADLNEAKREARMQLGQLAGERMQSRNLSSVEMESYTVATRTLEATGVPLHVCAELFSESYRVLKGRSILDAAKYYMKHYDPERPRKPLRELVLEFVESRKSNTVSEKYLISCRTTLRILLRAFGQRPLDDIDPASLDQMMEAHSSCNRSRNSYRIILVCFGNYLKKRGYLPSNKPTAFERMTTWRNEIKPVSIYTPEEMQKLLSRAHPGLLPFITIGAFAGLRSAEICRLDWSNVHFDRGFIECDAGMTKTRSRRLVPISDNLRAWLEPISQPKGRVVQYFDIGSSICPFYRKIGFSWKRNALRHSYISYRLALMPDTARVALECGNSPDVIFKFYRELVVPEQARAWFNLMPNAGYPANAPYYKRAAVGKKRVWLNPVVPRMKHDVLLEDSAAVAA